MGIVKSNLAISLDGFSSAPGQSREEPFGVGGGRLTEWMFETDLPGREADAAVRGTWSDGVGAFVMGRHMFGGYAGEWDLSWRGWWGDEPPYHAPVFVLTHHERAPLPMAGGTTFHFVTDGIESALAQARAAAGERDVDVAGGASTVRQAFAVGAIDELTLDIAPVLLGSGERLFDGVDDPGLSPVQVVHSEWATHVRYRVGR
jgi:dihydrofolate reductase